MSKLSLYKGIFFIISTILGSKLLLTYYLHWTFLIVLTSLFILTYFSIFIFRICNRFKSILRWVYKDLVKNINILLHKIYYFQKKRKHGVSFCFQKFHQVCHFSKSTNFRWIGHGKHEDSRKTYENILVNNK